MSELKWMVALLAAFCVIQPRVASAEETQPKLRPIQDVSMNDLIEGTQYMTDDPDRVTMAWWLPDEFWKVSLAEDPTTTEEGAAEILALVSQYTLVIYVDGEFGPMGGVSFVTPDQLRQRARLQGSDGQEVTPLDESDVSPDMMLLVGTMRPVIANMLGPFGQNMSFVLFPRKDANGRIIADATATDSFSMKLGDLSFPVTTPVHSLLAGKACATCDREFRGDYKYCPYDRAELQYTESE